MTPYDIKTIALRRLDNAAAGKERLEHTASTLYALAGELLDSEESSVVLYDQLVDAAVALRCAAATSTPISAVPFRALRARIVDA